MWTVETGEHKRRHVQTQNILSRIVVVQPCRQRRGLTAIPPQRAALLPGLCLASKKLFWRSNCSAEGDRKLATADTILTSQLPCLSAGLRLMRGGPINIPTPKSTSLVKFSPLPTWLGSQVQQMSFLLVSRGSRVDFKKWRPLHQHDCFSFFISNKEKKKNVIPIREDLGMRNSRCASQT